MAAGLPYPVRVPGPADKRPIDRGHGLDRLEIDPAAGAQFGLPPDHAHGGALDIGDFRTAEPESIPHARLLLLHGVGKAGRGPSPQRNS